MPPESDDSADGALPSRRRRAGRRAESEDSNWADLVGVWSSDADQMKDDGPTADPDPSVPGAPMLSRRDRGRRDPAPEAQPPGSPASVDPTRPWWAPSPGREPASSEPPLAPAADLPRRARPSGPVHTPPPFTAPGAPPVWSGGGDDLFTRPSRAHSSEPALPVPPPQVPVAPMPISERPAEAPARRSVARDQSPAARAAAQAAAAGFSAPAPGLPRPSFQPPATPPPADSLFTTRTPQPPARPTTLAPPPARAPHPTAPPTSAPQSTPQPTARELFAPSTAFTTTPPPTTPPSTPPPTTALPSTALPPATPPPPAARDPLGGLPQRPAAPRGADPRFGPATGSLPAVGAGPAPATGSFPAPGTGSPPRRRPSPYSNPPTGELYGDALRPDLRPDLRPEARADAPPPRERPATGRAPDPGLPSGPIIPVVTPPVMPPPLSSPPDTALTPFPLPPAPEGRGRGVKKGAKPKRAARRGRNELPSGPIPAIDETFLQDTPREVPGPPSGAGPDDLDATTTLPATRRRRTETPSRGTPAKKANKKSAEKAAAAARTVKPHTIDPPVMPGEHSPKENPHGRAGRNLPAAIGVGVGLAAITLASLFTRPEAFVALVSLVIVLAVWELAGAMAAKQIVIPVVPLAVGALGMLVSAYVAGEEGLLVSFTLTGFGVLLWRIIDGMDGAVRDVTAGLFAAAYVPLLAGFAILLLADDDGPKRVVVFILVTVASDIGGYATGVLFGKTPMAPTISPKKSWEGFAGSVVVCLVTGAAAVQFLLGGPFWAGLILGGCAAVTATLGDLSESLLKRDLGVKDMGSLLPGHGGIMDRLDSLLPTAPVAYLLLHLLVSST